jgi:hypothetical protein
MCTPFKGASCLGPVFSFVNCLRSQPQSGRGQSTGHRTPRRNAGRWPGLQVLRSYSRRAVITTYPQASRWVGAEMRTIMRGRSYFLL